MAKTRRRKSYRGKKRQKNKTRGAKTRRKVGGAWPFTSNNNKVGPMPPPPPPPTPKKTWQNVQYRADECFELLTIKKKNKDDLFKLINTACEKNKSMCSPAEINIYIKSLTKDPESATLFTVEDMMTEPDLIDSDGKFILTPEELFNFYDALYKEIDKLVNK